jgi:hypothetical protein
LDVYILWPENLDSGGVGRRFGVGGVVSREKGENDKFQGKQLNPSILKYICRTLNFV